MVNPSPRHVDKLTSSQHQRPLIRFLFGLMRAAEPDGFKLVVSPFKGACALELSLVVKVLAYRVVRRPNRAGYARQGIGGIIKIVTELANNLSSALFRPFAGGERCTGIEVTFQIHARQFLIQHGMQFGVELVKAGMDDAQFLTGFRYPFG